MLAVKVWEAFFPEQQVLPLKTMQRVFSTTSHVFKLLQHLQIYIWISQNSTDTSAKAPKQRHMPANATSFGLATKVSVVRPLHPSKNVSAFTHLKGNWNSREFSLYMFQCLVGINNPTQYLYCVSDTMIGKCVVGTW